MVKVGSILERKVKDIGQSKDSKQIPSRVKIIIAHEHGQLGSGGGKAGKVATHGKSFGKLARDTESFESGVRNLKLWTAVEI